jgi:hypothetical protein
MVRALVAGHHKNSNEPTSLEAKNSEVVLVVTFPPSHKTVAITAPYFSPIKHKPEARYKKHDQ